MANKTLNPSLKLQKLICDEITGKINSYEGRMSMRLARWVEAAELLQGKTSTQRENSRLSPNSVELYKAVRAITNMEYRMLTSQKPFFQLEPMDILGYSDPAKIIKSEHYVTQNLDLSRFPKGLHRAMYQLNLYGSVAVHEQYEPLRSSFLGKKRYITSYRPVSLINCAFALDSYDIEESGWVGLSDIQAKTSLIKCLSHDPEGKIYNLKALQAALDQPDYTPRTNSWVQQRMAWSGYITGNFVGGIERATYYGPLDCMHDNEEYAMEMVNREFIIRAESYEGIRPVRVCTINNLDVEPLGNGLGEQFRPILGQIDETRSSLLNTVTFAGANMWVKQKGLADEDMEFAIRNFGILGLENPDIKSLSPDPRTIAELTACKASQIQEFRQGSGATDTLQALVSGESATATEVSLSMNEAVRNISVGSELIAPVLVADHIKCILQNGQKYQTQPFTLVINKTPITCTPSDLQIDTDVRVLTMTDQNFRPARIKNLLAAAQMMINTPPDAMSGVKLNAGPTIVELLKLIDVPEWNNSVQTITDQDMIRAQVMQQMTQPVIPGQPGESASTPAENRVASQEPGRKEKRVLNRNQSLPMNTEATLRTPIGPVLSAPGDQSSATQAIRNASVAGNQEILRSK